MRYECATVAENIKIAEDVRRLTLRPASRARTSPGQFYMLRREGSALLLPRAVSLCDLQGDGLVFLFKVLGRGTLELSRLNPGDEVQLTGPLGNGWPIEELTGKRVALVGGGIGVAPLLLAAKALKERGNPAGCYLGYPDAPYLHEELEEVSASVSVATESGAAGRKGLVTAPLEEEIGGYEAVLCCGPGPMMKAVTELCVKAAVPVWVSMERGMACGVGACRACACADKQGHNLRVCREGPVFRGEEINFDA